MNTKVYLAGPLFSSAKRYWNLKLSEELKRLVPNLKIFLPQIECEEEMNNNPPDFERVAQICLNGVKSSDIILAVLDGADSDSGTCFECGFAYAINKPIITLRTDPRKCEDGNLNAMLSRTATTNIFILDTDPGKIAEEVVKAISSVFL